MTKITIFRDSDDVIRRFLVEGHAGFDVSGKDIVCASISMLTLNTINAIEKFTDDGFKVDINEKKATVEFELTQDEPSTETKVLLETLVLGYVGVNNEYGKRYIKIIFKEV